MKAEIIANLFCFTALISMFCYVEVLPFVSKKTKYITIGGTAAIVIANLLISTMFEDVPMSGISLYAQTIPSLLLCWMVSKHKGMCFWFTFCSVDVLGFMLVLIAKGMEILLHLDETVANILQVLLVASLGYIFYRYGKKFREVVDQNNINWGLLALFVSLLYGYSYFFILYPKPLVYRTEYAPVVVGYAVMVLLSYVFVVKTVVGSNKVNVLEQEEMKMKEQLDLQDKELQSQEAQIMLHQIRPHFIYNVLMTIRYLVKKNPQLACDMIYDFSKYLRSNVDSLVENKYILWKDELEHINAYVRIEEIRFGNRLNVIYDVEDGEFYLPPLTVEPLVENAIKHGIAPKAEGGTVWIRGSVVKNGYQIIVEDDGVGFHMERLEEEKSIGLNYIRKQLKKMPDTDMRIESAPGKGTKAVLFFGGGVNSSCDEENDSSDTEE